MVQRKAVMKAEKSFSTSHHFHHQETRNKGGGEVKKKKMNIQFDDAFKKSLPNYMKPTTCSGARKVTPVNHQTKTSCSGSKPAKILVRKSSLKHVRVGSSVVCNPRKTVRTSTCSSTQKDSKFPKALDLNPGSGTSVVKVCPYNYCSLNGHRHEALPPLKAFLESRRLSLKIEQRMKLKKKEIDAGKRVVNKNQPLVEELGDDFFVEIYAEELVVSCDQSEAVFDDNGSDCGSMMSLVEYVEFDQENELECVVSEQRGIEDAADLNDELECVSHAVCEDVPDEAFDGDDGEENLVDSVENSAGESAEVSITFEQLVSETDSDQECFEASDDETDDGDEELRKISRNRERTSDEFITSEIVSVSHEVCDDVPDEAFDGDDGEENLVGESAEVSITFEQLSETDSDQECFEASDDESTDGDEELRKISRNRASASDRCLTESTKLRMRITRKERTEEEEMMIREFNPRSPNFLACQPDPDNEKVDLKHQEMDDRKNAEEWMVDYALRQAVTKLSPASKRKVALLVKAFETVIPMRIQACS